MKLKTAIKNMIVASIGRLAGRHVLLLPPEAGDELKIFDVRAPYRIDGDVLRISLNDQRSGRLRMMLLGYIGHFPQETVWVSEPIEYGGHSVLSMRLDDGSVRMDEHEVGTVPLPLPGRRFCWKFRLDTTDGNRAERLTGHYIPGGDRPVEASYYSGDDYVDYEAETEADRRQVINRMAKLNSQGPVLDVGCAQGHLLAEIDKTGRDSFGVDFSEWAVAEAAQRLGAGRAFVCDIDREPLPAEITNRGPFGTIVIWAALEHFSEPFGVIDKLSEHARPGCHLLILTSNVDGIGRFIFGPEDWEGHFDWTHRGVEKVGVRSLREELPKLGWRIEEMATHLVWSKNADPTCAALRDCYQDARFRRLLEERELGDLVTCIAVRE